MKMLGKRIHDKREECKLTQAQLAKKLGVSRQTICKWEAGGVKHFDRAYIPKMSEIFHCSPEWLMNVDNAEVFVTYEAEGREPVRLRVSGDPIIGETSLRVKLYNAAMNVKPENLETAIKLLESMT